MDDRRKQQESRNSILGRADLVEDNDVHQTQDDCLQRRSPGTEDGKVTIIEQMQQLLMVGDLVDISSGSPPRPFVLARNKNRSVLGA